MKTVKEISELTGISIRALRYYDEIGLLVTTERTNAGYRLYDDKALEKLRAILFLRELDIPLDTMKEVVNAKNCDYGAVLKNYRKNIERNAERIHPVLVRTGRHAVPQAVRQSPRCPDHIIPLPVLCCGHRYSFLTLSKVRRQVLLRQLHVFLHRQYSGGT